jgi:hypothetical protein
MKMATTQISQPSRPGDTVCHLHHGLVIGVDLLGEPGLAEDAQPLSQVINLPGRPPRL